MSKGILQFDLPEEKDEFQAASNASKTQEFLHYLDNELRGIVKHGSSLICGDEF